MGLNDLFCAAAIMNRPCLLWGPLADQVSMALTCRWRSRPQHQERTHALQQDQSYSIASSASASASGGILSPSVLAVLRLITSSNLVGRSTGNSAGRAPLRILST